MRFHGTEEATEDAAAGGGGGEYNPSPGNRHQQSLDAFQALRSRGERRQRPADQLRGRSWPLHARLERRRHRRNAQTCFRLVSAPPAAANTKILEPIRRIMQGNDRRLNIGQPRQQPLLFLP